MQQPPTPDEVRQLVAPLDDLDRKVLGGLVALMIAAPGKVRDQEWLAEKFVHTAVVAHGFDDEGEATTEDVARIQAYARARMPDLVLVAASLFVRVAEDLKAAGGQPTMAAAREALRGYLAPPAAS